MSLEGTGAGLAAATAFCALGVALGQVSPVQAAAAALAAVAANYGESVAGATMQGRMEWLNNDAVNMIQILFAAALAMAACVLLP